jgi:hypothetical protein
MASCRYETWTSFTGRLARLVTTTTDATRAELRALLHELSDALFSSSNGRHVLLDGIRHAWVLADLADVREGLVRTLLRNLQRDLAQRPAECERAYFARQLTSAADQL